MQLEKDTLIDVSGITDKEFQSLQTRLISAGLNYPLFAFPVYADGSRIKQHLIGVSEKGLLCFWGQADGQKNVHYKEFI